LTRVLYTLGVIVAAIAIAARAVDDRRTLVPPPDAVAEEFVRQLVTGRSEQALPLLSEELKAAARPGLLNEYGRQLEAELGGVGNVSGELAGISGDRAEASAILDGARGTRRIRFGLRWQDGKWVIEQLGDLHGHRLAGPAI
jgi:hypothetical protein